MTKHKCMQCRAALSGDEIALHRKLFSRVAREFLCLDCMSQMMDVEKAKLISLINYYHRTGECALFAKTD